MHGAIDSGRWQSICYPHKYVGPSERFAAYSLSCCCCSPGYCGTAVGPMAAASMAAPLVAAPLVAAPLVAAAPMGHSPLQLLPWLLLL
jgi:hypothetical protein